MNSNLTFEIDSWYVWSSMFSGPLRYGKYWRRLTMVGTPGYEFKPYFPSAAYSLIVEDKCMKQYLDSHLIIKFTGSIEYLELFL